MIGLNTSCDGIFPNFQNRTHCKKDSKDNKHIVNCLHLGQKYARTFVLGHYLFFEAHSFLQATLSENCLLLETDNVHGQISKPIFVPNGVYCLYNTHIKSCILLGVYPNNSRSEIFFKIFIFCFECFSIQTEASSMAASIMHCIPQINLSNGILCMALSL